MNRPGRRTFKDQAAFIAANGSGPWPCTSCGELVQQLGRGRGFGNIHHVDDDVTNRDPRNLEVKHHECHSAFHPPSTVSRRAISRKLRGRPSPTRGMRFSAKTNRKKALPGPLNGFYGRQHTVQTLAKMSRPRRRERCGDCGRTYAINWITRHKQEGHCV